MLEQDAHGYRLPLQVRYPVEVHPPAGFKLDDPATWPRVDGRLEWLGGRLLYMPPCGDRQQDVTADIIFLLRSWSEAHPGFVVAGNEAGMMLGAEVRAADVAVWSRGAVGPYTGGFRHVAPILAVEVAGLDEAEAELRAKAQWYLRHGVRVVWIVFPESREVLVLTSASESRHAGSDRLVEHAEPPGLSPEVQSFFTQLG